MKKCLLLICLLYLAGTVSIAQQPCAFTLAEAQDMYDAGLIEQIPEKLTSCLKSGFSRDEKLQAYKLIILAYLFDDNIEQADSYMNRFLQEFPSYQPVATDPNEFIQLKETYDTDPIFTLGPVVGVNFANNFVTEPYSSDGYISESASYTSGNPGFLAGAQGNLKISSRLNLCTEVYFYHSSVDYYKEQFGWTAADIGFRKTEFYEQQNRMDIPVSLTYDFYSGNFVPYIRLGAKPGFLLGANADIVNTSEINGEQVGRSHEANYIKIGPQRNFLNMWAFAGGGVKYRLGPGFVFADLRLNYNLFNQTNERQRHSNDDTEYISIYTSDDFRMHDLAFSVGYLISFYNPKKKITEP